MRIVVASAAAALVAASLAAGAGRPTVSLVRASPVVVSGRGFRASAHIGVIYRSGATSARRVVVASPAGTFRIAFGRLRFTRCNGLSLVAGAAGVHVASCSLGGAPRLIADRAGDVAGRSFVPGERVVVTARESGEPPATATVRASDSGAFKTLLDVRPVACAQIEYMAVGALGSRAAFSAAAPECMAP